MVQASSTLWNDEPSDEPEPTPARLETEKLKQCTKCQRLLPLSEFHKFSGSLKPNGRHNMTRDGLHTRCKECVYQRKRTLHLQQTYGITAAEYDAMLARQGGVCAICGGVNVAEVKPRDDRQRAPRRNMDALYVDHDHFTGKARGLLCHHCNAAIGHFRDDSDILRKAIAYLEAHGNA